MSWSSFLRAPAWLYALALFALGAAVGLMGKRLGMDANPAVAAVVLGLLVVIAVGGTVLYWRRLDEAAREAHKFAWYWGGSLGLGASVLLVNALQAMGADAIVVRHHGSGAAHLLAHSGWIEAHVLNAGDGTHEHPTQALLDAFTIRQRCYGADSRGRDLSGMRVVIVGDILHSRVARSNVWLLTTLGAEVHLVAPRTLLPSGVETWPVRVHEHLESALALDVDAVMMLRIQQERMHDAFFPSAREYAREWGLTAERFAALGPDTMVMHPGPMNRGLEISSAAADSARSTVLDQVTNGVFIRMAVLYLLVAGSPEASA